MIDIANGSNQLLKEVIPEWCYEHDEFLKATNTDTLPDGFAEDDDMLERFCIRPCIRQIGRAAFSGCKSLIEVIFEGSPYKIGDMTFKNCTSLDLEYLPDSIQKFGIGTFYGCTGISELYLPRGVRELPAYSLYGCTGLRKVWAHDYIKVRDRAMKNCTSLTDISGVIEELGKEAFSGCTSLISADIAANLISEGSYAGCSSLRSLHFRIIPVLFEQDCFLGCISLEDVTADGSSYQLRSADGYCELARNIRVLDEEKIKDMIRDTIKQRKLAEIAG